MPQHITLGNQKNAVFKTQNSLRSMRGQLQILNIPQRGPGDRHGLWTHGSKSISTTEIMTRELKGK